MTLKSLNFSLLVVSFETDTLESLSEELNQKKEIAPDFFKSAPIVIKIENSDVEIDFEHLKEIVKEQSFSLVGVTGELSQQQKETATTHGIAILKSSKHQQGKEVLLAVDEVREEPIAFVAPEIKAKVHNGRVRSGQQIYAKDSDLVVNGNVSAGAEVIADGNIHIYGVLNGKAIAGAMGDLKSKVFCHVFSPELISIAGVYKLSETLPSIFQGKSCIVSLKDEKLEFTRFCQIDNKD